MSNSSKPYHKIIIINWKWKRKLLPDLPHLQKTESAKKDIIQFKKEFEDRVIIDSVKNSENSHHKKGILRVKADLSRRSMEEGIVALKEELRRFIIHSTLEKCEQVLFFSHRNYLGTDSIQKYKEGWVYQNFLNLETIVYHLLDYNTADYGIDVFEEIEGKRLINEEIFSIVWDSAWTQWHEKLVHLYNKLNKFTLGVGKENKDSIKIRVSTMAANFDSTGYEEFKEFNGNAYIKKLKKKDEINKEIDNMDLPLPYFYAGFIRKKDNSIVEDIRKVIFAIARGDISKDNLLLAKNLIGKVIQ